MDLAHAHWEPAGAGPHPTIVALHGWGASALDLIGLAPYLAGGRFLVLCPQGALTLRLPAGFGYGWFPLTAFGQASTESPLDAVVDALRSFLARAIERYPIDTQKLVLLGFSQGGVLAYQLAFAEPTRFAGLAALSSWLPSAMVAQLASRPGLDRLPTLIQHGSNDEIIAVARARQSVEALREHRLPLTYREYAMAHEINAESLADLSTWLEEKVLSPIIRV